MEPGFMFLLITAACASGVGGLLICLRKQWSEESLLAMVSAGGGLLLSVTILDLLPHNAVEENHALMPFVLVGFGLLFLLDMLGQKVEKLGSSNVLGVVVGFSIHAFVEGLSLMASFALNAKLGVSLLVALILHKIPDGITVASLLLAATKSRSAALLGSVVLGMATLLGAFSMEVVDRWLPPQWSQVVIAVTTGVFLYVAASHLVPLILHARRAQLAVYFFAGMIAYTLLSILLHTNVQPHV